MATSISSSSSDDNRRRSGHEESFRLATEPTVDGRSRLGAGLLLMGDGHGDDVDADEVPPPYLPQAGPRPSCPRCSPSPGPQNCCPNPGCLASPPPPLSLEGSDRCQKVKPV